MSEQILIVEDETRLAALLADYLKAAGYRTHCLAEGNGAVEWVREHEPALVLLDLMLPGTDGLDICRRVRGFSQVPIIMTTARVEEIDRLLGLELGADDYVCKPYSPREVVARVRAVLRRTRAEQVRSAVTAGPLALDDDRLRVRTASGEIQLTAVEYALLKALVGTPGKIFSRARLMDRIYDDHRVVSDRTIDSHVKKLRRRLTEILPPDRELIHSVYGVGYRYEDMEG
ncbi:MAG: response regulator [Thiohalocapsa sp.]|jgi:two-component system response regulator BaeR|uniref:response regulator n=1 Tax=Thiohalocapsa sp. TaxID=2497641 RepID=UPI0025D542BB|nr:response regulator [Thiohalocapsa sp.]MCG6943131.1 response regulator [Thiohalocapsa sp.]